MPDTGSCELKLTFDAVYYYVTDIEKSVAFYQDVLGLRLTSRDYVARFHIDGVLFELVPNAAGNALPGTGNARLSLGVNDIHEATCALQARDVPTTPIKEESDGLLSFFKDPDGNELCLWQTVAIPIAKQTRTVCDPAGLPALEIIKSEDGTVTLFEADDMDNKVLFPASIISALVQQLNTLK